MVLIEETPNTINYEIAEFVGNKRNTTNRDRYSISTYLPSSNTDSDTFGINTCRLVVHHNLTSSVVVFDSMIVVYPRPCVFSNCGAYRRNLDMEISSTSGTTCKTSPSGDGQGFLMLKVCGRRHPCRALIIRMSLEPQRNKVAENCLRILKSSGSPL